MLLEQTQPRDAAGVVDDAAPGAVLVFGSLPGAGRDLDLLVRDGDLDALRTALDREGFRSKGDEWVRFAGGTADAVDLVPASSWRLPPTELDELFRTALPIDGFARLVRPAPARALLVLARLTGLGPLPDKRRRRRDAALAEDPGAWNDARRHAAAWNLTAELASLEGGGTATRGLPRPSRPRIVALSGIDGSGKSSQAELLRTALERLGYDAAVEWSPFGHDAWLDRLAVPVKRLLARIGRYTPAEPARETGLERTSGTALREENAVVNYAWSAVVTFANELSQLATIARHTRRGRIVIYDRYALDSTVQLRFRYGSTGRFALQRALIRLLAPKPVAAFYLDIPPETSLGRKDDRWTLADLETQTHLYREEYQQAGIVRLDGLRPREELAAKIAEAVWRSLG
jgi:thymidylate kinase